MTLYYTIVFVLLVAEMALFGALVLLPRQLRKGLLNSFVKLGPLLDRVLLALKFTFVFILVLFIDAVNRVYRSQADFEKLRGSGNIAQQALYNSDDIQARRFYAQRNMYLCGFTLFLSLILNRTYVLVVQLTNTEDKLKALSKGDDSVEVAQLKAELRKKQLDIETLKKQSDALSKEYYKVSDENNAKNDVTPSDKKND